MENILINENLARRAQEMNSFRDYKEGQATSEYNAYLKKFDDEVKELVTAYPQNATAEVIELVNYYKEKYAQNLANAINESNRIECMMPSIMISGGGNFNVRKKEKQNQARQNFYNKCGSLFTSDNFYIKKIRILLTNKVIYSDDALAIEKIKNKISDLKEHHEKMKAINAYYRKNKTLKGCELLSGCDDELLEQMDKEILQSWYKTPYASFELTNNNAEIHRLEDRVKELERMKERAEKPTEDKYINVEGLKIEENAEDMRIRLFFEDIPSEEIRNILKSWGFRWSPYNKAWQRQLTTNGIRATKQALEQISALIKA